MSTALAVLLSVAGVFALVFGAGVTGRWFAGGPMMLELWLAAGLIRLSQSMSWSSLAVVVVLIVLRKVTAAAIAHAGRALSS